MQLEWGEMKELEEKIGFGDLADVEVVVSAWLFEEFTKGLNPTVFVGIAFFFGPADKFRNH